MTTPAPNPPAPTPDDGGDHFDPMTADFGADDLLDEVGLEDLELEDEPPVAPAPKPAPAKVESPKAKTPKAEPSKTEAPKADAPKPVAPKAEAPTSEEPKAAAPKPAAPKTEAPKAVAPKTDTMPKATELPATPEPDAKPTLQESTPRAAAVNEEAAAETATSEDADQETAEAPEAAAETNDLDVLPEALRSAFERQGFKSLTQVQRAVIDSEHAGRDLRISSQTGSGKTVALGIAMAQSLIEARDEGPAPGPRALVIAPTRELADQVRGELEWLFADVKGIRVDCVTGGTHVGQERRRLQRRPMILVGTPGRLGDHLRSGALDCSETSQLILDEADQMLDMGFRDELDAIVAELPEERHTHLVSATFPRAVRDLAERFQNNPVSVEGTALGSANADIRHVGHIVRERDRYGALVNLLLLADDQRVLVFVARRADAAVLSEKLTQDGFGAMALSGDLAQRQRTRTLETFRSGAIRVLVATDVAARGIDVADISMVVHGDLPFNGEIYTHRSGRTGRAGNLGRSIMLVSPAAERRARRIFSDARVEAEWQSVPSAVDVERALKKRVRRRNRKLVEDASPSEEQLLIAREMLENVDDPAKVVAALLSASEASQRCEARDIETPAPRAPRQRDRDRQFGNDRQFGGEGGRQHGNARREGPESGFTRFKINYGFRDGANPRRILATVCRRGDVTSAVVGAIEVDAKFTSFDVANSAARNFEKNAIRIDKRNPRQRIERDNGGPRSSNERYASSNS